MKTEIPFHEQPFERRKSIAQKISETYPDRVPVIVSPSGNAPVISKTKFLAPNDIDVAQFISMIRKHIAVTPEKALFVFVEESNNSMIMAQPAAVIDQLYQRHKQPDGFLYVHYTLENTFG